MGVALFSRALQKSYLTTVARQVSDVAIELHANAPRTGKSVNVFGELRSPVGGVPAVEFGDTLEAMKKIDFIGDVANVTVNRVELELGQGVEPRPMVDRVLQKVRV